MYLENSKYKKKLLKRFYSNSFIWLLYDICDDHQSRRKENEKQKSRETAVLVFKNI